MAKQKDLTASEYKKIYKVTREHGFYDINMEEVESCDVKNGSWVLITRTPSIDKYYQPQLFGIYWGIPNEDRYGRQTCIIHTTTDVVLLNHEYTVLSEEKVNVYREEGWELHETMVNTIAPMNLELIQRGRELCEEEREIVWALQLDGLNETQACEEYFLSRHTDYNNFSICFLPKQEIARELIQTFGLR